MAVMSTPQRRKRKGHHGKVGVAAGENEEPVCDAVFVIMATAHLMLST